MNEKSLKESVVEFVEDFNKTNNNGCVLEICDLLEVCEKNDVSAKDIEKLLNVVDSIKQINVEKRKSIECALYEYVYQYNHSDHKGLRLSIANVRFCDTKRILWYVSLFYRNKRLISNFKICNWEKLRLLKTEVSKHEIVEGQETPNIEKLRSENKRLKYLKMCKVCEDKDSNRVCLPCGHLCTCELCCPALKNCPICKKVIRGTVSVFLPY